MIRLRGLGLTYKTWDPNALPLNPPMSPLGQDDCLVPCGLPLTPACAPICGATQLSSVPATPLIPSAPVITTPAPAPASTASTGFSLSDIPIWVWLALAGGALFFLKGHK